MGTPRDVTPEYYQILVVRELRRAGLDVGEPRIQRRSELPEPERGFVLELTTFIGRDAGRKRALLACYRQTGAIGVETVRQLAQRLEKARADIGVLIATGDFEVEAVAAAQQAGIVLLRVVDGRQAYAQPPAWLPAHTLHQVVRDEGGAVRLQPLNAGSFEARS